ncbi:MAG: sialidase family protein, partial [Candidatus Eisenbacteria bacterium]
MRMPRRSFGPFPLLLSALLLLSARSGAEDFLNQRLNQDATTELQNEQQIAVNPADPNNMVAVWRDFRLGYRQVGWACTFDGGYTWTEGGLFQEPNYPWQSDPALTASVGGVFYAVLLSYTSTSEPNGLFLYRSTDGGATWGAPLEVIDQVPAVFEDKEFVACDRTGGAHDGNLYVAWSRFGYSSDIVFRRTANGGMTWGPVLAVDDDNGSQFPIPVVGRGGEVFVAWSNYYDEVIKIDVSNDGGVSFGTDRTVTGVYSVYNVLNGDINAYASPHMDADITDGPHAGRLYLAFMDRRGGSGDFDIWVMTSDDGALHWSAPARVNDDPFNNGRDQFLPWLTVDNLGVVTIVFLDRRHDPANRTYHCYLAQSLDGGATWSPNVRVSTEPSDPVHALREAAGPAAETAGKSGDVSSAAAPSVSRAGLLGEYIGVASWDGYPVPVWTDIRNLHQDTYAGYPLVKTRVAERKAASFRPELAVAPHPVRIGGEATVRAPFGGGVLHMYDVRGRLVRSFPFGSRTISLSVLGGRGWGGRGGPSA